MEIVWKRLTAGATRVGIVYLHNQNLGKTASLQEDGERGKGLDGASKG